MYVITLPAIEKHSGSKATIDPVTGEKSYEPIWKSSIAMQAEKAALIKAKEDEIQQKVSSYLSAQESQGVGNPAPFAEPEIKEIVNGHDGKFKVVMEE
jgi:hypothetical protein